MGISSTSGTLVPLVPVKQRADWPFGKYWFLGFFLVLSPLYQVVADLVPSEYLDACVLLVLMLICGLPVSVSVTYPVFSACCCWLYGLFAQLG
jgi:hypothetical protein